MQQLSLDELKQVLFHAFRDHLTMKDIENIIITEEESLNENSGNCPEYEGGEELRFAPQFRPKICFKDEKDIPDNHRDRGHALWKHFTVMEHWEG